MQLQNCKKKYFSQTREKTLDNMKMMWYILIASSKNATEEKSHMLYADKLQFIFTFFIVWFSFVRIMKDGHNNEQRKNRMVWQNSNGTWKYCRGNYNHGCGILRFKVVWQFVGGRVQLCKHRPGDFYDMYYCYVVYLYGQQKFC